MTKEIKLFSETEKMENIQKGSNISLLNLPESTLDYILKLLSPMDLIQMSQVCTYLRDKCRSNHLWHNHINQKWGRVIGEVAYKEWKWHITTAKEGTNLFNQNLNENGSLGTFSGTWPMLCLGSYLEDCKQINGSLANWLMMSLYFSLENGKFWFPAQVYRGLVVSDALVKYNSKTDTFQARHRCGSWRVMGNNIKWDKLRSLPLESPPSPCVRHLSADSSSQDLKPGDHIEIQWKSSSEAPYDWWYGVVGHLDSCSQNENYCCCHDSETLIVEFRQYPQGSSMRRIKLLRNNNNGEIGLNPVGIYGGIRKLHTEEEIQRWKNLLPQPQTHPVVQQEARIICFVRPRPQQI